MAGCQNGLCSVNGDTVTWTHVTIISYVTEDILASSHKEANESLQVILAGLIIPGHPCLMNDLLYRSMLLGVAKGRVSNLQQYLSEVVSLCAV